MLAKTRLWFGLNPSGGKNILDVHIAFFKEANSHGGHHGRITLTSPSRGLRAAEVGFVFVGLTNPPAISPMVVQYIWDKAKEQNYIPHHIVHYGTTLRTSDGLPVNTIISASRREAEDAAAKSRFQSLDSQARQHKTKTAELVTS